MTGTPIQNNLRELWALLYLLKNKSFNDWAVFSEHYEKPISKGMIAVVRAAATLLPECVRGE